MDANLLLKKNENDDLFGETVCYKVRNADRFHNKRFQSQQIVISLSNSYIGRERERGQG